MNGARRLFKMIEDFAGNLGFGTSAQEDKITTTMSLPLSSTISSTISTTAAIPSSTTSMPPSVNIDYYKELLEKYAATATTMSSTTSTTSKPKTMLEQVKENGAFSTWNMNKRDKWKLLSQLSKSYLENRLGKRSISGAGTVASDLSSFLSGLEASVLHDIVKPQYSSPEDGTISDQSNIIPTFGVPETLVRGPYDKYLPRPSRTQIRKKRDKGGGFSIFSLLNFMLVVLNIIIDINNNINNNNNNNNNNNK